jgi:hypothetical protein
MSSPNQQYLTSTDLKYLDGGERDEQPTFPFVIDAARYAPLSTGVERNGWRSHRRHA